MADKLGKHWCGYSLNRKKNEEFEWRREKSGSDIMK